MFLHAVGFGIVTAAVMALAAVGFTIQFGVTNILNLGGVLPYIGRIGLTQNYCIYDAQSSPWVMKHRWRPGGQTARRGQRPKRRGRISCGRS